MGDVIIPLLNVPISKDCVLRTMLFRVNILQSCESDAESFRTTDLRTPSDWIITQLLAA